MGYYWHNKIYNLHLILKERDIPHLFFNAFNAFQVANTAEQLDWDDCFFHPYQQNLCYINYCVEHEFEEITPGWQHYNEDAHAAWAQTLVDHMNQQQVYDSICKR